MKADHSTKSFFFIVQLVLFSTLSGFCKSSIFVRGPSYKYDIMEKITGKIQPWFWTQKYVQRVCDAEMVFFVSTLEEEHI